MGGRQRKPRTTLAGRFLRGRRLDDNPLRRASDRAETWMLILLAAAFLVIAPTLAPAMGAWVHATAQRAELHQAASRYQVSAVVLEAPSQPVTGYRDFLSQATARWTAPNGLVVTGETPVAAGTRVGAKLTVWTTRDGRLTSSPLDDSQVRVLTGLGEVTGVTALALLLTLVGGLARWLINRRRLAGWDAEWQTTEPRWTTRA
jgi:hypothetical protein